MSTGHPRTYASRLYRTHTFEDIELQFCASLLFGWTNSPHGYIDLNCQILGNVVPVCCLVTGEHVTAKHPSVFCDLFWKESLTVAFVCRTGIFAHLGFLSPASSATMNFAKIIDFINHICTPILFIYNINKFHWGSKSKCQSPKPIVWVFKSTYFRVINGLTSMFLPFRISVQYASWEVNHL